MIRHSICVQLLQSPCTAWINENKGEVELRPPTFTCEYTSSILVAQERYLPRCVQRREQVPTTVLDFLSTERPPSSDCDAFRNHGVLNYRRSTWKVPRGSVCWHFQRFKTPMELVDALIILFVSKPHRPQVLSLSVSTRNARKNGAPYRHLLLYGPPGTGKTMVAKRLASALG